MHSSSSRGECCEDPRSLNFKSVRSTRLRMLSRIPDPCLQSSQSSSLDSLFQELEVAAQLAFSLYSRNREFKVLLWLCNYAFLRINPGCNFQARLLSWSSLFPRAEVERDRAASTSQIA